MDLIDREATLNALGERPMVWTPDDDYSLGERNQYDIDRLAIETVPSADIDLSGFSDRLWKTAYERGKAEAVRWIPVSEQLPEDEQEVLFSTKTGRVHLGRYYNDNSVNQWYSSLDKMRAWNNVVNAWMPLPEPYKDGEQDG